MKLQDAAKTILSLVGEDINRPGLVRTPIRFEKSFAFLTSGYQENIDAIINNALFEEKAQCTVTVKDIEFYSLCEHHLLPFFGTVDVAYIPNGKVIGLSKIPRIVNMYARRLQVQERLTHQIADTIEEVLAPKGIYIRITAHHLCMMMRGVEKNNSTTKNIFIRFAQ